MKSPEMQEIRNTLREALRRNKEEAIQLHRQMEAFQSKCNHTQVYGKLSSDTGNYDRTQDDYWIDAICPECGRYFTAFASNNEEEYLSLRKRMIKEVEKLEDYSPWKS
jgi:DNA repair exonuclease SbcCD ATPase subunit